MEWARIKTVIIIILAVLNFILIAMVLSNLISSKKLEIQEKEDIITVLENNGISMDKKAITNFDSVSLFEGYRDTEEEKALAEKLLGACTAEDKGGNVYYYYNDNGWATFRGDGDIEFEFYAGLWYEGFEEKAVKELEKYGFVFGEEYDGTREGMQTVDDYSVVNCEIVLHYRDDLLVSFEGKGMITELTQSEDTSSDCSTALIRFIEKLNKEGYICTEISNVEISYAMEIPHTGIFSLKEVWIITADTGIYYLS